MKNTSLLILFLLILGSPCNINSQDTDISQIPMYGYVKKSKEQQKSDREFIDLCKKSGKSLNQASTEYVEQGWYYLHQDDQKTSIRRFNQAWLLDSANVVVYASFVTYLAIKNESDTDTKNMMDRTIKMKPNGREVWDMLFSFGIVAHRKTKKTLVFDYLAKKLKTSSLTKSEKKDILKKISDYKASIGGTIQLTTP